MQNINLIFVAQLPDTRRTAEVSLRRINEAIKMAVNMDFANFNRDVDSICKLGKAKEAFVLLKQSIIASVDEGFQEILRENDKKTSKDLLIATQTFWLNHALKLIKLSEAFFNLEKTMLLNFSKQNKIHHEMKMEIDQGHQLESADSFKIQSIGVSAIQLNFSAQQRGQKALQQIIEDIQYQITIYRQQYLEKKFYDQSKLIQIRDIIQMFLALDLYQSHFQQKLLEKTSHFYRMQSNTLISKLQPEEYLKLVHETLINEVTLVKDYFDMQTLNSMVLALEEVLIKDHHKEILEKAFPKALKDKNIDILKLIYTYFHETKLLSQLKAAWVGLIKSIGKEIMGHIHIQKKASVLVGMKKILDLKELTDRALVECFNGKEEFRSGQKEGFEQFLNQETSPEVSANIIAIFVDKMKQKESQQSKSKEFTEELKNIKPELIISVFRYLTAKDTFEVFFTKYLSNRLLEKKSASHEEERDFIAKLKNECGNLFTSRCEQMFVDIRNSSELQKNFYSQRKHRNLPIEMDFFVLSQNSWPIQPIQNVIKIPKEISDSANLFKDFYKSSFQKRDLIWSLDHCSCLIKGIFQSGDYQFEASGIQGLLLLAFNAKASLSIGEIREHTGLLDDQIKVSLVSLTIGDHNLLNWEGQGKDHEILHSEDILIVKTDFHNKLKRMNINKVPKSERKALEETKNIDHKVKEDRKFQIDAAIVKTMKEHKSLAHNMLLQKLFEKLKFPIEASSIMERVESLIDKDYLKHNNLDNSIYEYVA